jgi:hypothetical protein
VHVCFYSDAEGRFIIDDQGAAAMRAEGMLCI